MRFCKVRFAKAILAVALIPASGARGSVLMVTDTKDTTRVTSLRGAVIAANSRARDWSRRSNTILLGGPDWQHRSPTGATFRLTIPGPDETNGLKGDLDVTRGNLTIVGVGRRVTIDARSLGDRALHVHKGAALILENVIITGAHAAPGSNWELAGEPGGAIYNEGTLTMVDCSIVGNSSGEGGYALGNDWQPPGGDGGGVYSVGTLTMIKCAVSSNLCGGLSAFGESGRGGGIWNSGTAILNDCLLEGNAASGGQVQPAMGFGGYGASGGGIYSSGTLNLYSCIVRRNLSGAGAAGNMPGWANMYTPGSPGGAGGSGGGVFNSGKLRLVFCLVSDNRAGPGGDGGNGPGGGGAGGVGGSGGAIYSSGALVLNACTVNGNATGNGGSSGSGMWTGGAGADGGSGGGICSGGSSALTNCTITGNFTGRGGNGGNGNPSGSSGGAGGFGGGIYSTGALDFISCTVCSNVTGGGGAGGGGTAFGVAVQYGPGPPIEAFGGSGGNGGSGGGVFSATNFAARAGNNLVALNLAADGGVGGPGYIVYWDTNAQGFATSNTLAQAGSPGSGTDLAGTFVSLGFNLIGQAEGATGFTNGLNGDLPGSAQAPIDPLIGPLRMNGGPTPSHALLPGSPAIDQGNRLGIHSDERGLQRPHDYPGIPNPPGGDGSDIGAFELDSKR